jgi:hypothetical protein
VSRVRTLTRGEASLGDLQEALDSMGVENGDQFAICPLATLLDGRKPPTRRTDPDTSRAAAETITPEKLRASHEAVLEVFRLHGPMIDEELVAACDRMAAEGRIRKQAESGIRTRRRELADAMLVVDTGEKRANAAGNPSIVWRAAGPDNMTLDYTGGGDDGQ